MATKIDYLNKDYESARSFLLAQAQDRLRGKVDDVTEAEVLNVMTELFAMIWDMLSYYQDAQAREALFMDALTRPAVKSGAKVLGWSLSSAAPASASVRITIPAQSGDATVRAGSLATATAANGDTIYFELQSDVVIPAGQTTATLAMIEGRTLTDTFDALGQASQAYDLLNLPYLDGSMVIRVNGESGWTEVETFAFAGATDENGKVYRLIVQEDGRARVVYGNGVNGKAPNGVLSHTYRVGGGKRGNVQIGQIDTWAGTISMDGSSVSVTAVTNLAAASGGQEQESLEAAKVNAPAKLRTNFRTVGLEDFEANSVGGSILRAFAANYEMDPTAILVNTVRLYAIPAGGESGARELTGPEYVNGTQMKLIRDRLTKTNPKVATARLEILSARFKPVNIAGTVSPLPNVNTTALRMAIVTALSNLDGSGGFFDVTRKRSDGSFALQWGQPVFLSELIAAIQAVPGVRNVNLTAPTVNDLQVEYNQIPSLGTTTGLLVQ